MARMVAAPEHGAGWHLALFLALALN